MSKFTLEQANARFNDTVVKLAETQAIVTMMSCAENKEYVDDHNGGGRVRSLDGWVLVEYNSQLCPFPINGRGACLNPLYIGDDGKVHLSRWSIGPYLPSLDAVSDAKLNYITL